MAPRSTHFAFSLPSCNMLLRSFATLSLAAFVLIGAVGYSTPAIQTQVAPAPAPAPHCNICGEIKNISYPFRLSGDQYSQCPHWDNQYFDLICDADKLYVKTYPTAYFLTALNVSNFTDSNFPAELFDALEVKEFREDSLIVSNSDFNTTMHTNSSDICLKSYTTYIYLPAVGEGPFVLSNENELASFGCSTAIMYTMGIRRGADNRNYLWEGQDTGGCSVIQPRNMEDTGFGNCNQQTCSCTYQFHSNSTVLGIRYASLSVDEAIFLENSTDFKNASLCPLNCSHNNATVFYKNNYDQMKLTWAFPLPVNNTPFSDALIYNRSSSDDPVLLEEDSDLAKSIRNLSDYACAKNNSKILLVGSVWGYRCSCEDGYSGDGYLNGTRCRDIDECIVGNNCTSNSRCKNNEGGYTCECKSKFHIGDGRKDKNGCHFPNIAIYIILGITSGLVLITTTYILFKWWKTIVKKRNFMQNGGLELQQYVQRRGRDVTRLFTYDELKQATQNFSTSMKIGVGGFGVVYKGILANGREVAIKMANKHLGYENEEFVNEIAILSQINHRHIVKLLGCCLETTSPLLVYEYVSNGNLGDNLEMKGGIVMTWDQRLKVAKQISEALAYLHSIASPPILHRDVKSTNILLDSNWDAKVADFGVSRLLPEGTEHVSTAIKGTLGYLDPEYFQTLQLTEKSDVYSLGVVLVELMTSLKPVDNRNRSPGLSNLALLFLHHMKEGTTQELIDHRLLCIDNDQNNANPWKIQSSIMSVAMLTRCCLSLLGTDRPSMSMVSNELNNLYNTLVFGDPSDEACVPLLNRYDACDGGAVVTKNSEYFVQSSLSKSMSISNSMVHTPTMPR